MIEGFDNVGVAVTDYRAAVDFYEKLGFKVDFEEAEGRQPESRQRRALRVQDFLHDHAAKQGPVTYRQPAGHRPTSACACLTSTPSTPGSARPA